MNEAAIAQAFCDAVKAHPACGSLAGVLQWRVAESKEVLVLPAVRFDARDVQPIGVGAFSTGTVEVRLETQIDDETEETHLARANLLTVALSDAATLTATINAADPRRVRLSGYALNGGGRGVDGRRWTASVLLRVGFAPAA